MRQKKNKSGRKSKLCIGQDGVVYDSLFECDCANALRNLVVYRGGNTYDEEVVINGEVVIRKANPNFRAIKIKIKAGTKTKFTIPDFEIVGAKNCFIEAKGNLNLRSRDNIQGLLDLGMLVGVCFVNEKAANQPLWPKCTTTKAQWLQNRSVPFSFGSGSVVALLKEVLGAG